MTASNQSFSVTSGDDYTVVFRNYDENGNKLLLNNYTNAWTIDTPTIIFKTNGVMNGNELTFTLNGVDTKDLKGNYDHSLVVYDYNNKKYTISKGTITFI